MWRHISLLPYKTQLILNTISFMHQNNNTHVLTCQSTESWHRYNTSDRHFFTKWSSCTVCFRWPAINTRRVLNLMTSVAFSCKMNSLSKCRNWFWVIWNSPCPNKSRFESGRENAFFRPILNQWNSLPLPTRDSHASNTVGILWYFVLAKTSSLTFARTSVNNSPISPPRSVHCTARAIDQNSQKWQVIASFPYSKDERTDSR